MYPGLGAVGETKQWVFDDGKGGTSVVAATEMEARSILRLDEGVPLMQTYRTAPLPTATVNGRQVVDPVAAKAYDDAVRAGKTFMEALDIAQAAALAARGVLNLTPGPQDSTVDLTPPSPSPSSPGALGPRVTLAGMGGKLGLLVAAGLALAMFRRKR